MTREEILKIVEEKHISSYEELIEVSGLTSEKIREIFLGYVKEYNNVRRKIRLNSKGS